MDLPVGTLSKKKLYVSDVDELDDIRRDASNITINISSITSVKGHHRPGIAPKLEVRWNDGVEKSTEFVEQETGSSRHRNLNDWAPVIERLRAGKQKIAMLPPPPDRDSLEGRILIDLDDMQEKGLLTIEREVEKKFGRRPRDRPGGSGVRGAGRPGISSRRRPRPRKLRSTSRSRHSERTT